MAWRGLTWDHPRGYGALRAAAGLQALIDWNTHSLEGFESAPIQDICSRYDLVVLDHPHLGEAIAQSCLRPLDEVFDAKDLARIAAASIGRTYDSYHMDGRQWALPLDAATQVMAVRADLLAKVDSGHAGQLNQDTPTQAAHGPVNVPKTWDEVRALSASTGKVALSLAGPHALLSLLSIAAAIDPTADLRNGDRWHTKATITQACELLLELAARSPASVRALNPIGLLAHMTTHDDVILCPLVYGYVNYASASLAQPLAFHDAPSAKPGIPGSILGGTGIAISRRCEPDAALREHLLWLMSEATQTGFIPLHDGQPSNVASWADPQVNALSDDFYRQTTRTLAAASVRPRHDGYIAFQDRGSALLREGIAAGTSASQLADALAQLFADTHSSSRTPA
ncbi:extracellular solute-binding protein [Pigmentiphaga aceris]|uniref:Extracellular solute-binding protein n=1 Tax=Pigmentiphaga aceris TaxID=1940612 RepID=A0A5C0B822_9BURK|nr:extracellular solute-binding protein [Pigmentiphaga aceris]